MNTEEDEAVFQLASALEEDELDEFLEESFSSNEELRERLKQHRAEEDTALHTNHLPSEVAFGLPGPDGKLVGESAGSRIGPYTLVKSLGVGGMGTVWMAEQDEPVKRTVALKIIKAGMDSAEVIARFGAERQALAMMEHSYIAQVYDAGATANGRPYFVMELVPGMPITEFCDKHRLPPRKRLELFMEVCNGLQHAHQKGVIHRDIKPSNILVNERDRKHLPKLIDFGIAKATGDDLSEHTVHTRLGQMMGTPVYMSPEQAAGEGHRVDTRTDVYALGVLLYELLTGTTPISAEDLRGLGYAQMQRMVAESEPPWPSTRLERAGEAAREVARRRGIEPAAKLGKLIRGDLDWIVMKALEREPERRYETVRGFADDIERYLNSEPVEASPPSTIYRLTKFARRHRGLLRAAALVSLVVLFAIAFNLVDRSRMKRDQAESQFDALFEAPPDRLPAVMADVRRFDRILHKELQEVAADPEQRPRDRARARLALFPREGRGAPEVAAWLVDSAPGNLAGPEELRAFLELLGPKREFLLDDALRVVADERAHREQRLRAAAIGATIDPRHPKLRRFSREISGWLVSRTVVDADRWLPLLEPMSGELLKPLEAIFDAEPNHPVGQVAALALSEFQKNDRIRLIALARKAGGQQLPHIARVLADDSERSKSELERALRTGLAEEPRRDAELAKLGIVLLKMDAPETVWPLLRNDAVPDLRTELIHSLADYNIDFRLLTERMQVEQEPGILSALMLSLGDFNLAQLPGPARTQIRTAQLEPLYATHPDPGVRSAARWLVGKWLIAEWTSDPGQANKIGEKLAQSLRGHFEQLDKAPPKDKAARERDWYLTRYHDFTMAHIRGPVAFQMGSPEEEKERRDDEKQHEERLEHSFAIATTEVPRELFEQFLEEAGLVNERDIAQRDRFSSGPGCAVTVVSLKKAMWFCYWFSEREGIPAAQQCYEIDRETGELRTKDRWLELTGYRLPTEAEWEYACRAGTTTARFSGRNVEHLTEYAWYSAAAAEPDRHTRIPGLLRPNPFGLSDILGNGAELCQELYIENYRSDSESASFIVVETPGQQGTVRGGSFYHLRPGVRSSWRGVVDSPGMFFSSIRLAVSVRDN